MLGRMTFSQRERQNLAQALLEHGPEAPTLCEGWTTRDLAEHLYTRERSQIAMVPAVGARAKQRIAQMDYHELVNEWAGGPPALIKPIDSAMNTAEHFIHHEDVRRGDGEVRVREFSRAVDQELLKWAARFGALTLRKSPVPVILSPTSLPPVTIGRGRGVSERGDDVVRVVGEPGEILLWASGRDVADVQLQGTDENIAKARP